MKRLLLKTSKVRRSKNEKIPSEIQIADLAQNPPHVPRHIERNAMNSLGSRSVLQISFFLISVRFYANQMTSLWVFDERMQVLRNSRGVLHFIHVCHFSS